MTHTGYIFLGAKVFNQDISRWRLNVKTGDCEHMFDGCGLPSEYKPIKVYQIRSDADIKDAVNLWCSHRAEAESRYGHISDWDVSSVTDMSWLFNGKKVFNDDISRWNVSAVTNMMMMFCGATEFNQPIGEWKTGNVTNMAFMFNDAAKFNQPIGGWNTSNLIDAGACFQNATSFNQPIGAWNGKYSEYV